MNKQQMLEQIDELKQKIEELEKEITSPEFEGIKKSVRWKPECDEEYFYIDSFGGICHDDWCDDYQDLFRFNTGNCFKTEQEALDFKENLLTKQQLKDLVLELNNGVEVDWAKNGQLKFSIYLNHQGNLVQYECLYCPDLGQVYCLDRNFLDIAKERIGEEELIKLIKSGGVKW